MAYCTLDDILRMLPEQTLVELTDDDGLGTVDTGRANEAIAQADAEIDGYCGGRYGVPVAGPPPILRKLSVDIAVYHLYSRRVQESPPVRAERYKAAVRLLENIAKGTVTLGVTGTTVPSAEPDGAETNKPSDTNTFTRNSMGGF